MEPLNSLMPERAVRHPCSQEQYWAVNDGSSLMPEKAGRHPCSQEQYWAVNDGSLMPEKAGRITMCNTKEFLGENREIAEWKQEKSGI